MWFDDITVAKADGTVLPHQTVVVRDTRIAYVGPDRPAQDEGERVEGSGRLLMPGLVNAHTHVAMTLMRGYGDDLPLDTWLTGRIFPFEDKLTGEDVYWGSLLGMAEMIATGTTSFTDMYYFCDRIAEAALACGIKANIGRGISCFDPAKSFRDLPAYGEIRELLSSMQGAGEGRIRIDVAPHSEYTTRPDILYDAAALAAETGARMQVHLSETSKEQLECVARHGKTPAQLLKDTGVLENPVTLAHCVWLTELDMDLIAVARDATIAHCAKSNLKLGSGIAQVKKWGEWGIPAAIGTDSAASNNALDMFEEMRTASLLAKGIDRDPLALPAAKTLYMATRAGALSQGRETAGDIVPGYQADLVLVDLETPSMTPCHSAVSNLVYAANGGAVRMTMVDGRILYRDGRFLTLDIDEVRARAAEAVRAVQAR